MFRLLGNSKLPTDKELKEIGEVTHYFAKISVAVVELKDTLRVGDRILIQGDTSNFEQTVESMQIEHENIESAGAGQSIGLKVDQRVREGDCVYRVLS
ncbi:MAG: U32 family peptidase C-terminal domain-containing protein [Candidatus Bathyarchaeota archaeon]|nr:MAG: U32 family peptidase C-terminal domain-containing protein [Candidatus Bathyarchaeota archaeon]